MSFTKNGGIIGQQLQQNREILLGYFRFIGSLRLSKAQQFCYLFVLCCYFLLNRIGKAQ